MYDNLYWSWKKDWNDEFEQVLVDLLVCIEEDIKPKMGYNKILESFDGILEEL